jgi:hypothetical protein
MPTNNSSGMPTDSLNTESQNAALQNKPSQNSSQNVENDSSNVGAYKK